MQNLRLVIIAVLGVAVGIVTGILGYIWFTGGSGIGSTPISAPTLDLNAQPTLDLTQALAAGTQAGQLQAENANLLVTISALESALSAVNAVTADTIPPTSAPTLAPTTAPTAIPQPTATEAGQRALYRIDGSQSEVRFVLEEERNGTRADVIGTTNQIAGDVIVDRPNPMASQVGTIRISARALATGDEVRDRALRAQILRSSQDDYEFIEFVPTALNGLPNAIYLGQTYSFEIVGNLTLIDTTREVTFQAQAQLVTENQLTGTATATITWFDWGINVPSVPEVTDVAPDATLTIDFVANRVPA